MDARQRSGSMNCMRPETWDMLLVFFYTNLRGDKPDDHHTSPYRTTLTPCFTILHTRLACSCLVVCMTVYWVRVGWGQTGNRGASGKGIGRIWRGGMVLGDGFCEGRGTDGIMGWTAQSFLPSYPDLASCLLLMGFFLLLLSFASVRSQFTPP